MNGVMMHKVQHAVHSPRSQLHQNLDTSLKSHFVFFRPSPALIAGARHPRIGASRALGAEIDQVFSRQVPFWSCVTVLGHGHC